MRNGAAKKRVREKNFLFPVYIIISADLSKGEVIGTLLLRTFPAQLVSWVMPKGILKCLSSFASPKSTGSWVR